MREFRETWSDFKTKCIVGKKLNYQWHDDGDSYLVLGPEFNIEWVSVVPKQIPDPNNEGEFIANPDATDFENNYKAKGNQPLMQVDSDGATMSRSKIAPSGWTFHLRMLEFATASVGSLVNLDPSGNTLTDAVASFYDADNTAITDPANNAACVKTVLDIEPPYDYYVIGGMYKMITQPNVDVRLSVIGVPDVPANYGGSKVLVQNVNLKYLLPSDGVNADGRAPKWLAYSPTYHTNKLRFQILHPAGFQLQSAVMLEYYKV